MPKRFFFIFMILKTINIKYELYNFTGIQDDQPNKKQL